jgi:hypothetical protein
MIYLLGGSGAPNYGDELIIRNWIQYLSEAGIHQKVSIDCNNIKNSEQLHGSYGDVTFTKFIREHAATDKSSAFFEQILRGRRFVQDGLARASIIKDGPLDFFGDVKVFHFYGGGYTNTTIAPHSGFLLGAAAELKKSFGFPLYATGQGVLPLNLPDKASKDLLAATIAGFDFYECRDPWGYSKLRYATGHSSNLINGLEDSYLYPARRSSKRSGKPKLHLSLKSDLTPEYEAWLNKQIQKLSEEFDELFYWECVPYKDGPIFDRVKAEIPTTRKCTVSEMLDEGLPVDKGDFMVTYRFHPHLMASRLGACGYMMADSEYYAVKHRSILNLGSPFRYMVKHMELKSFHTPYSLILESEAECVAMKRQTADQIYRLLPS